MKDLEYVLRFALQVIEDNALESTKNNDNWFIGKALEEQIEQVKNLNIAIVSNNEVVCCGNCHLPLDNVEIVPKVQIADKKYNP